MTKSNTRALAMAAAVGLVCYQVVDSLRHNGRRYSPDGPNDTVWLTEDEADTLRKHEPPVIGDIVEGIQPESERTDGGQGKDALDGGGGDAGGTGNGGDSTGREPGKDAEGADKTAGDEDAAKSKTGAKAAGKQTKSK